MTHMKPESLDRLREYFHEYPKDLVELIVRVTDDFYDMHVSNAPHRPFIEAWEKKKRRGKKVEFLIPESVIFFAKVAGEGILQNLSWEVVKNIANAVWFSGNKKGAGFEAVVSVETYRKVRSQNHPGTQPARKALEDFEETIRKEYTFSVRRK